MSSLQGRRVIIASLFLPVTLIPHEDDATVAADHRDVGQATPQQSATKPAIGSRPGPIASILDDLAIKSKVATPISTPHKEATNPFFSFSSINDALSHAGTAARVVVAPVVDAINSANEFRVQRQASQRPAQRTASRSSSTSRYSPGYSTSIGQWTFATNPHANGGLQNAVKSVDATLSRKTWIGVLGSPTDALDGDFRHSIDQKLKTAYDSVPVWVPDAELAGCYDGFCHQVLWPTLHYAVPDAPRTKSFYESNTYSQYVGVNQKFADAIVAEYQPGDIVWVNDYHLMLVPRLVREKLPQAIIGFFLHVAWPSSEIFRCLAVRQDLLRGILGADLVGTQTHNFARHFRNCASRILALEAVPKGIQLDNRFVDVAVFPMGIDVDRLTRKRSEPEVAEWINVLGQRYSGLKLIVGRDKLDEVQGVRQKILAFEKFLERHPEFRGKAVLIQVALVTSEENELQGRVSDVVARVNSKFSTLTYQPIVFLHTHELTFSQYLALLSLADAFLVTSLREGMALRAHEYVECQEGKAGPLILSEFAGSYSFSGFRSCIPCNPWDTVATCEAIFQALTMPAEEAAARWKDLHAHVVTQTAQSFVLSFLSRSVRVHKEHQLPPAASIPLLRAEVLHDTYAIPGRRLLLLDLEGCVWDRNPRSRSHVIPEDVKQVITRLAGDADNHVWLLSGLSMAVLQKSLGVLFDAVGICAENGCFLKPPRTEGKTDTWISMVSDLDDSWIPAAKEILSYFTERTPGSFIDDSDASVTWRFWSDEHNMDAERVWARRQAAEAQNHLWDSLGERFGLRIVPRTNSFLVLPNKISRSSAVGIILKMYDIAALGASMTAADQTLPALGEHVRFILAVSRDDRLLGRLNSVPNSVTCSASGKGSEAKWKLPGPADVLELVSGLQ